MAADRRVRAGIIVTVTGIVVALLGLPGQSAEVGAAPPTSVGLHAMLTAAHSDLCATVSDASPGSAVTQQPCRSGIDSSLWEQRPTTEGAFELVSSATGLCLTVAGASADNGAAVVAATCADRAEQHFDLARTSTSNQIAVVARHSGSCLDVASSSELAGAALVQWSCVERASQRWTRNEPGIDFDTLSSDPVPHWGVVGTGLTVTRPKPQVWDFAEIGDRIFVAGAFTGVQRNGFDPGAVTEAQAYLAAFDRDSGAWISTFRPTFDRTIYTLDVSPDGLLLVGGEFTTVNGVARGGLVALDPNSGATAPSFVASVGRVGDPLPIVRVLEVHDGDLYVGGEFNYYVRGGSQNWVFNAIRLRAETGDLDPTWLPRFAGSVWDIAIDGSRGRAHAVGFFTSANASPATNRFATVTTASGATVPGLAQLQFNTGGQIDTVAVAFSGDRIWVGGAQHIIQTLDPVTNQRLTFSHTGSTCNGFALTGCTFAGGGDYQVIEAAGTSVVGGCHCFRPSDQYANGTTWDAINHYSSVDGRRSEQRAAIAYDAVTGALASPFVPGVATAQHGVWAVHIDANGCYYLGGTLRRTEAGGWLGGIAKFCQPVPQVDGLAAASADRDVRLSWSTPNSHLPVLYAKVYRDGIFIGDATGESFTDTGREVAAQHTYSIRLRDSAGRLGAERTVVATVAGADTEAPSVVTELNATALEDDVTLTWNAAVDDQGVREYLVHRDYQFVGLVPAANGVARFDDEGVAAGTHRYDVRARDYGDNLSLPVSVNVHLGVADVAAPEVPAGVTADAVGAAVTLRWAPSDDLPLENPSGLAGYLVHRDFQYLAWVPVGETYVDASVAAGSHRYDIRSQDGAGNTSAPSTVTIAVGAPDTEAPTTPDNVTATVDGTTVTLAWNASTDLPADGASGIKGYLVHRDFQYVAWVPAGETYVDASVAVGTHRYEIRAQDRAGNNSAPSAPTTVEVL